MAILDQWTLDFVSNSLEQTVRLGVRMGELLEPGDILCLSGDLGAGKTSLARGIGRGWGTALRVTSPTFTIVNEYPRPRDGRILYHLDCYRLDSLADVVTAGVEDILAAEGVLMIEWPERVLDILPEDRVWIVMSYVSDTRRKLHIKAVGERSQAVLDAFRRSAFGV
jgi:tRNA threonylcarbamoyladenosine biosynthesis protein TsaE